MKLEDLPEQYKSYVIGLSNGTTYIISGLEADLIMKSSSQFSKLATGEYINKSFIVSIKLDKTKTRDDYNNLSDEKKIEIEQHFNQELIFEKL